MNIGEAILDACCTFTHGQDTRDYAAWLRCIAILRKHDGRFLSVEQIAKEANVLVGKVPRLMNEHNAIDRAVSARGDDNRFLWRAV